MTYFLWSLMWSPRFFQDHSQTAFSKWFKLCNFLKNIQMNDASALYDDVITKMVMQILLTNSHKSGMSDNYAV